MNWDAIGAIGEMLGAIAVFATLVYLALQVRNARTEMQISIRQNRDSTIRELMLEQVRSPSLNAAVSKGWIKFGEQPLVKVLRDAADLTPEEAQSFSMYYIAWWFYRAETINQLSALTPSQRVDFDSNIANNYGRGLGKVWFEEWKKSRDPEDPTLQYCLRILQSRGDT